MKSFRDVFPAKVWSNVLQIRGPVHSTAWVGVLEPDIVHVVTFSSAVSFSHHGLVKDILQDLLANRDIDSITGSGLVESFQADSFLRVKSLSNI